MVLVYCGIERAFATGSRKNAILRIPGTLANIPRQKLVPEEASGWYVSPCKYKAFQQHARVRANETPTLV